MDADGSRSGSSPHHNDYGSEFSLLRVCLCSKFEFAMFSVLRLYLVLCLVFCVCCHTNV